MGMPIRPAPDNPPAAIVVNDNGGVVHITDPTLLNIVHLIPGLNIVPIAPVD